MTTAPRPQLKVYFDGGCRPNPGRLEAAVVVRGVTHLFDDLGYGTSSDAEWMALISALNLTQALGLERIQFVGDSLEVVRQANRALTSGQVSNGHAATFLNLTVDARPVRIRWIKREQNLAGIALAGRHAR